MSSGGNSILDLYSTSFSGNTANGMEWNGNFGGNDIFNDGGGNTVTIHASCAPGSSGSTSQGVPLDTSESLYGNDNIAGDGESLVVAPSSSSR